MAPGTDLRRLPQDALARLRRRVVRAVARGGIQERVATRFGLRPATVSGWMARFRSDGDGGLRDGPRGRPATLPGDGLWLRQVLADPPGDAPLWTMPAVAAALTAAGGCPVSPAAGRRRLIAQGLLPERLADWARTALAGRARSENGYLAVASVQGFPPEAWTFSLVQATGRLAFWIQAGPFRLARWIGFLARVERHVAGRPAVVLVHPPALAHRPGVLRWLASRPPGLVLAGAPGRA